ncbi:MAG: hypothetical protein OXI86_04425, partial [Candidatus Poribacteria bacterium]|nr:hypothetical protein [Candidatus Poribacteria bacterium]
MADFYRSSTALVIHSLAGFLSWSVGREAAGWKSGIPEGNQSLTVSEVRKESSLFVFCPKNHTAVNQFRRRRWVSLEYRF